MIASSGHGSDYLKKRIESELRAAIEIDSNSDSFGSESESTERISLAKKVAENIFDFIQNKTFIYKEPEGDRSHATLLENKIDDTLIKIKSFEGDCAIDKIKNYIENTISEIAKEHKKGTKGKDSPSEKETEKIKENIKEAIDTRAKNFIRNPNSVVQKIEKPEKIIEETLKTLLRKSKKRTRKRRKNKNLSEIVLMNKVQAIFGKKILAYKAAKKKLKIKGRFTDDDKIYISIDNSGSMLTHLKKVCQFMHKIKSISNDIMYSNWNSRLNFNFKKLENTFNYNPEGEDNLYYSSMESIMAIKEKNESSLVVITDGTTRLTKEEFKTIIETAESNNVYFILMSFGITSEYCVPPGYEDRLIAY